MPEQPIFIASSKNSRQIRLTPTIWRKILNEHPEFLRGDYLRDVRKTIEDPEYLVTGWEGADLALRWCEGGPGRAKHLGVVFRELNGEGFIITAFFVSRYERLLKRGITWQRS